MSAVSKSVMPRSSALWTTLRVASRSIRPPKLLQPKPTRETRRPELPRLRSCIRSPSIPAAKAREVARRHALGPERVLRRGGVLVADRQAAHHDLFGGKPELAPDRRVERRERRLGAGVEAVAARRRHDIAEEDAVIEPAADLEPAVDREDHADGRVEEDEVARVLRLHPRRLAAGDAEEAVEVPADLAASRQIRLEEAIRVVLVLGAMRRAFGMRPHERGGEALLGLAREHVYAPGLHVGAARRPRRDVEDTLDERARHRGWQEGAHRSARCDRRFDDRRGAGIRHPPRPPYFATRTTSLPKFLPLSRPMKAWGALSRPSTTSSRYLILPSRSHSPTSVANSRAWAWKSQTMKPRMVRRFVNTARKIAAVRSGPGGSSVML